MPEPAKNPAVDMSDLRHLAKLARLAVSDEQLVKYGDQLHAILGYVQRISQADVGGIEPMAHPLPVSNAFRDDVVGDSLQLEKVLQNAPDSDGPFFKVPKIIGGDDDSAN
jgi:aspartyl-tRNA(Asn)/glutamyl-tRNA(Gln) amidotransferase subunit C